MASTTGLTYDDLPEMFPEETNRRVELIGGELTVAPSPSLRHQRVVRRTQGRYRRPTILGRGETLDTPLLPGFSAPVDDILGAA